MKAVILATNESANLAPLTDNLPSPMLPLNGMPLMAHTIELLSRAGINDIVICLQHMAGSIEAWFGSGRRWGVNIKYSLQRDPLGDAGSINWAKGYLDDSFIILPGDSLNDLNIEELIESHKQSKSLATIVMRNSYPLNQDPAKTGSKENTGVYIFEPKILDFIPSRGSFNIEDQLIPLLQEKGIEANYFNHIGYWNPIHSFQDLKDAQKAYLLSATEKSLENDKDKSCTFQHPTIPGNRFGNNVWVGRNNIIHPSVRIFPPVVIGDNCQVGKDVELGPYTIIGSNSIIDDEASIRQSTITEKTYVGKLVNVEDKIVRRNLMIDFLSGSSTYVTDRFLLGEASPPLLISGARQLFDKILVVIIIIFLAPLLLIIGLFSLLRTGRILKTVRRIGNTQPDAKDKGIGAQRHFELKHFNTRKADNSLSTIARWLEQSELNRLPELFGIISGNLSLIGVKPLLPKEAELIVEEWEYQRYSLSPGFTGLWYTENNGSDNYEDAIVHDIYYITVRGFKEDLRILLKTPIKWLRKLPYSR